MPLHEFTRIFEIVSRTTLHDIGRHARFHRPLDRDLAATALIAMSRSVNVPVGRVISSQIGRKPIPQSRIFRAASRTDVCGDTHSTSVVMSSLRVV
jgi:hypothetical protein